MCGIKPLAGPSALVILLFQKSGTLPRPALASGPWPLPYPAPKVRSIPAWGHAPEAEAGRMEAVRGLIPAFEAKIARTLARVWGTPPTVD